MLETIKNQLPISISQNFIIENITNDYKKDLYEIYSNENIAKYVARKTHTSIEDTEEFLDIIEKRISEDTNLYLGIYTINHRKLIGIIRLLRKEEPNILTLGYALNKEFWGRGIVPLAVNSLIPFIKQDGNYSILRATIREENINSRRCIEKLGFELNGKLKKAEVIEGNEVESDRLLYYREF